MNKQERVRTFDRKRTLLHTLILTTFILVAPGIIVPLMVEAHKNFLLTFFHLPESKFVSLWWFISSSVGCIGTYIGLQILKRLEEHAKRKDKYYIVVVPAFAGIKLYYWWPIIFIISTIYLFIL